MPLRLTSMLFAAAVSFAALPAAAGFNAYVSGDYRAALQEWLPLGEAGDAEAQFGIGIMHQLGKGVPRDFAEAVTWFRRAAMQGSVRAQTQLAGMYARGDGIDQNWVEAVAWWREAAGQGGARGQFRRGAAYQYGNGIERDLEAAKRWYGEAADQGYGRAGGKLEEVVRLQREEDAAVAALAVGPELGATATAGPQGAEAAPENVEAAAAYGGAGPAQAVVLPLLLPVPTEDEPAAGATIATLGPTYRIHLASFPSVDDAETGWRRLVRAGGALLAPLQPTFDRVDLGPVLGEVYHLRAGPLADAESASALCEALAERDVRCKVVAPE